MSYYESGPCSKEDFDRSIMECNEVLALLDEKLEPKVFRETDGVIHTVYWCHAGEAVLAQYNPFQESERFSIVNARLLNSIIFADVTK